MAEQHNDVDRLKSLINKGFAHHFIFRIKHLIFLGSFHQISILFVIQRSHRLRKVQAFLHQQRISWSSSNRKSPLARIKWSKCCAGRICSAIWPFLKLKFHSKNAKLRKNKLRNPFANCKPIQCTSPLCESIKIQPAFSAQLIVFSCVFFFQSKIEMLKVNCWFVYTNGREVHSNEFTLYLLTYLNFHGSGYKYNESHSIQLVWFWRSIVMIIKSS